MRVWLFTLLLCCLGTALAQSSSQRCRWLRIAADTSGSSLDSLTVLPSSIQVSTYSHTYNSQTGKIKIFGATDSVFVCYRVFPLSFTKTYFKRDASRYDSSKSFIEDYGRSYSVVERREELFASPGIQKNGTISRGISFGNNQNVFVNSTLNLQLEGKLTEDVSMVAVISDQNIPFQADGNTQQLQEFDKVYVQLKTQRSTLTAGDLVLKNQPSEFLRYYRNVQGGLVEHARKDSTQQTFISAGAAISKGKFNSMVFGYGGGDTLIEGVQGPYRLRGPNNERFIIVLANSEKVYLDGRLLKRGWEYDYTIDYNLAEITFTNQVLITRFSRVRVDFEFSDRNYSRLITALSAHERYKSVYGYVHYYLERDNPNNPLFQDLSQEEIDRLSLIGDTINRAFISGIDSSGFVQNKVLYKKIISGSNVIYQYSTHPDSAFFDIRFSQVPPGNGSYVLENTTVNGRVFRYVGFPNGNYEPVQIIPLPTRKQMWTAGAGLDLGKQISVFSEAAFSQHDLNQYSSADAFDDQGWSIKSGVRWAERPTRYRYKFSGTLNYEYNQKYFTPVDRFRSADFERFWGESGLVADNNMLEAAFQAKRNDANKINYKVIRRIKPGDVDGQQHNAQLYQSIRNWHMELDGFRMNNEKVASEVRWNRYSANTFYKTKWWVPGYTYSSEQNSITDAAGNISSSLMYFEEHKAYMRNGDSTQLKYLIEYAERNDREVFAGTLQPNSSSATMNATLGGTWKEQIIRTGFSYRYLNNSIGPTPFANEETVTGRLEWSGSILHQHLRSELLLVSATGRELRREFNYLPVPVGQGTHVWNDFNSDGVQQLDEFSEKKFDDINGEFIKVFVPTDTYVKAFSNTLNYQIDVSAPRTWRSGKGKIKKWVSRLSNITSLNSQKKITDPDILKRFNPFSTSIAETDIISMQNAWRSTLFYNRTSPKFGCDINYNYIENKQFLSQGFESRFVNEWNGLLRANLSNHWSTKNSIGWLYRKNASDFLATRNYAIEGYKCNPGISYQPNRSVRLSALLGYMEKYNRLSIQKVMFREAGAEIKVNKVSHRSLQGQAKLIVITSNLTSADINSPLGFEMLEALRPGQNMTWNFNWQEKLSNGLQLTFSYEGRRSKDVPTVHIGRMQVSALF